MKKYTNCLFFVVFGSLTLTLCGVVPRTAQKSGASNNKFGVSRLFPENKKMAQIYLAKDLKIDIQNEEFENLVSLIGLKITGLNIKWTSMSGAVPPLTIKKNIKLSELLVLLENTIGAKIFFTEESKLLQLVIQLP